MSLILILNLIFILTLCKSQNVTLDVYAAVTNNNLTLEDFQRMVDGEVIKNESPFGPNFPTIATATIIKNRLDLISALMQSNSTSLDTE